MWLSSLKNTLHLAYAIAVNLARQHEVTQTTPSHQTIMHIFIHLKCVGECIKNKKEVSKNSKTFHLETQDRFNYPSQMQCGL